MNDQKLVEMAQHLMDTAAPQLRAYAYANWVGDIGILICFAVATIVFWKLGKHIAKKLELDPDVVFMAYIPFGIIATIFGILLPLFVQWSLQVFAAPELCGLRLLIP